MSPSSHPGSKPIMDQTHLKKEGSDKAPISVLPQFKVMCTRRLLTDSLFEDSWIYQYSINAMEGECRG